MGKYEDKIPDPSAVSFLALPEDSGNWPAVLDPNQALALARGDSGQFSVLEGPLPLDTQELRALDDLDMDFELTDSLLNKRVKLLLWLLFVIGLAAGGLHYGSKLLSSDQKNDTAKTRKVHLDQQKGPVIHALGPPLDSYPK